MKESAFVRQNKPRWEAFEKIIKSQHEADPDKLAHLYIQVTDDLSFAKTKFPGTRTANYLNALAARLRSSLYRNKPEDKNRFITFWKYDVPLAMYDARRPLIYSLLVFVVAGLMGAISAYNDDTFARLIMSDEYINMTLENIRNGKPTGVYGILDEGNMFVMITLNNIMVSFNVFVYGLFFSVGTAYRLFQTGMMVGTFLSFFYKESSLAHALPVIMLHGTIELSAIVIAGAAGFVMGNSLIFPGTYSRLESFKQGAMKGMKIMVGLVPFFVLAGFIESFITRYEFMHWSIKVMIILASTLLMIYYFVIYPTLLKKHGKLHTDRCSSSGLHAN
jgi:uncharacterized membrane protein SpoIIM required for sporulation